MKWDQIETYAPKSQQNGNADFYRLKEGDNKLRIVSEPEVRGVHWVDNRGITCVGELEGCKFCKFCKDEAPSPKFLFYIIDREDGMLKIAEFGYSIVRQLADYQSNPDYAFDAIPSYDVTIKKEGQKQKTKYTVIPARKNSELTATEIALASAIKPLCEVVEAFKKREKKVPAPSSDEITLEQLGAV